MMITTQMHHTQQHQVCTKYFKHIMVEKFINKSLQILYLTVVECQQHTKYTRASEPLEFLQL